MIDTSKSQKGSLAAGLLVLELVFGVRLEPFADSAGSASSVAVPFVGLASFAAAAAFVGSASFAVAA